MVRFRRTQQIYELIGEVGQVQTSIQGLDEISLFLRSRLWYHTVKTLQLVLQTTSVIFSNVRRLATYPSKPLTLIKLIKMKMKIRDMCRYIFDQVSISCILSMNCCKLGLCFQTETCNEIIKLSSLYLEFAVLAN